MSELMEKHEAEFEQLPEKTLENNYGDFRSCEGAWNPMTRADAKRFLTAAKNFNDSMLAMGSSHLVLTGSGAPLEDPEKAMDEMVETGCVLYLPLGYMRAKNDLPKCPRCGCSIMDEAHQAVSRYDNTTVICSDCGTIEAMENYTRTITD